MKLNKAVIAGIIIASAIAVAVVTTPSSALGKIPYQQTKNIVAGQGVYKDNCAGCHGLNLEGQPDWRKRSSEGYLPAPPHDETGHTWHHPDQMLFEFVKFGPQHFAGLNYKTIMPPYKDILSDEAIWNVLAYIKAQWPEKIQKQHTETFGDL